jgi:hypothetical protein
MPCGLFGRYLAQAPPPEKSDGSSVRGLRLLTLLGRTMTGGRSGIRLPNYRSAARATRTAAQKMRTS